MGMTLLRGDETAEEIIVLAYGMETGLRDFYRLMAHHTKENKVVDTFTKLADIEDIHKKKLFQLYGHLNSSISDMKTFEENTVNKVMEGGGSVEEFVDRNRDMINTVPTVLELAISIEAQSLDLYLRYSEKSSDGETKTVLFEIAEEEKSHLATLGRLMDESL